MAESRVNTDKIREALIIQGFPILCRWWDLNPRDDDRKRSACADLQKLVAISVAVSFAAAVDSIAKLSK